MLKSTQLLLLMLVLGIPACVRAEFQMKLKVNRFPSDDVEAVGRITRPQICPIDSDWIAYEVHSGPRIELHIYNSQTHENRLVHPPQRESDSEIGGAGGGNFNGDFAWRPVKDRSGKIWAAFVSNVEQTQDLYIYDVSGDKYSPPLRSADDSLGAGDKSLPSWSPDGICLTYTSTSSKTGMDIYIIFGMDEVLKDPASPKVPERHKCLIKEEGDQKGAVWCPVSSTGYFAYVNTPPQELKFEIKVYDAMQRKAFDFENPELDKQYLCPNWSPNGKWLAYYLADLEDIRDLQGASKTILRADTSLGSRGLGIASIVPRTTALGDSVVITPQQGNVRPTYNIMNVSRNDDTRLGPAWLPNSRHLLVSCYEERKHNPIGIVDVSEWRDNGYESDWLGKFELDTFDWPREISTADRNVAFTYAQGQKTVLLMGQVDAIGNYNPGDKLQVSKDRRDWWKTYSETGKLKPGKGAIGFLVDPVVGPDFLLINRPIVMVPACVIAYLLLRPQDHIFIGEPRKWGLPAFPSKAKAMKGVSFKLMF